MSDENVSFTVEDSAYDLMEGLTAVVKAVQAAKASGVVAETEAGVATAIAAFSTKIGELQGMKADLLADHTAFYRGLLNGALDLGTALMG